VRQVYNILYLISDLGGVITGFMVFCGVFLYPISEFSFYLKISKRLFLARTKDESFFKHSKGNVHDHTHCELERSQTMTSEISKHREIKISNLDKLRLFVSK
jgi:hypothetical protein